MFRDSRVTPKLCKQDTSDLNPKKRAARQERRELLWKLVRRYEPSLVQLSTHAYFLSLGVYIYICIYIYIQNILVSIKLKPGALKITEVLIIIYV
jgi:hypothetical protein